VELDAQAKGLVTRDGGRAGHGEIGAIAEIWAQ